MLRRYSASSRRVVAARRLKSSDPGQEKMRRPKSANF
jgi:hypothetical protein